MKKKIIVGLSMMITSLLATTTFVTMIFFFGLRNSHVSFNNNITQSYDPTSFSSENTVSIPISITKINNSYFLTIKDSQVVKNNIYYGNISLSSNGDYSQKSNNIEVNNPSKNISIFFDKGNDLYNLEEVLLINESSNNEFLTTKNASNSSLDYFKFILNLPSNDLDKKWVNANLNLKLIFSKKTKKPTNNTYIYSVSKDASFNDLILDDSVHNDLYEKINAFKNSDPNIKTNIFVYLNSRTIYVGNFTVPEGCDLHFINNENDSGIGYVKGTKLDENGDFILDEKKEPIAGIGKIVVNGIVTFWRSVHSKEIIFDIK